MTPEAKSTRRGTIRVLLTAFGGFPGAAVNPTQAIAAQLSGKRGAALGLGGIDLVTASLPVEYAAIENSIEMLLEKHRPDCVLHLGLAGSRHAISIETRSRNRLNTIHPDAAGHHAERLICTSEANYFRRASYRVPRILNAMRRARANVALSIDAGDYLCNQALFATLGQFTGPAGFIHVPRPRILSRPIRTQRSARMSIEDMARAVEAAIRDMAQQGRASALNGVQPI